MFSQILTWSKVSKWVEFIKYKLFLAFKLCTSQLLAMSITWSNFKNNMSCVKISNLRGQVNVQCRSNEMKNKMKVSPCSHLTSRGGDNVACGSSWYKGSTW